MLIKSPLDLTNGTSPVSTAVPLFLEVNDFSALLVSRVPRDTNVYSSSSNHILVNMLVNPSVLCVLCAAETRGEAAYCPESDATETRTGRFLQLSGS